MAEQTTPKNPLQSGNTRRNIEALANRIESVYAEVMAGNLDMDVCNTRLDKVIERANEIDARFAEASWTPQTKKELRQMAANGALVHATNLMNDTTVGQKARLARAAVNRLASGKTGMPRGKAKAVKADSEPTSK